MRGCHFGGIIMMPKSAYSTIIAFLFIFFLGSLPLIAQQEKYGHESSGEGDHRVFIYSDSTMAGDSIRFSIPRESFQDSEVFYDSLKHKAKRNYITGLLYDFLMEDGSSHALSNAGTIDEYATPYESYRGRPIRKIRIRQMNVFENLLQDTSAESQWYEDVGNWIHVPTHRSIIRENLLFSKGDRLDPSLLKDNGRIIRNLQYIKDARFIVNPAHESGDSVDVIVLTQDLWAKGFDVNLESINSGEIQLFDNNFFGMGHKFQANLIFDYFKPSNPGIETFYKVNNIQGTFIQGHLYYLNAFETNRYGFEIERDFYSYKTRMAGGVSVFRTHTRKNIVQEDTTFNQTRLNFINHDVWYGYAFRLNSSSDFYKDRNRLVISARFRDDRYFKHPEVTERYNYRFHDNQLYMGKISFSRENFYKSALIYGFGRTEDIPVGDLVSYTLGWEKDQFFRRFYSGLHLKHGQFIPNFGYLSAGLDAGGFFYEDRIEQGAIRLESQYISKLFNVKGLKIRQFFNLDYTRGINRFPEENLGFDRYTDIRGFLNGGLYGDQKLVLKSETVGFTDIYYYGFRLALYGFLDVGFLGPEDQFILNNQMKSGFGLGVRLRNENFVFNTFQIRLGFYPTLTNGRQLLFNLSGDKTLSPDGYIPDPPQVVKF